MDFLSGLSVRGRGWDKLLLLRNSLAKAEAGKCPHVAAFAYVMSVNIPFAKASWAVQHVPPTGREENGYYQWSRSVAVTFPGVSWPAFKVLVPSFTFALLLLLCFLPFLNTPHDPVTYCAFYLFISFIFSFHWNVFHQRSALCVFHSSVVPNRYLAQWLNEVMLENVLRWIQEMCLT